MGRSTCMECGDVLNRGNPRARKCMPCIRSTTKEMNERRKNHRVNKEMREKLKDEYPQCAYCGGQSEGGWSLEVDHVMPVVRGGKTTMDNLVLACRSCNRSKANKTPQEWGGP